MILVTMLVNYKQVLQYDTSYKYSNHCNLIIFVGISVFYAINLDVETYSHIYPLDFSEFEFTYLMAC